MAISTIGSDGLATSAVTSTKLASGVPTTAQLPAGTVLQVVNATTSSEVQSTSSSYANTGLSASITPSSSSSKVLVIVNQAGLGRGVTNNYMGLKLLRDSTELKLIEFEATYTGSSQNNSCGGTGISYLDSPASTSALTYKTQFNSQSPPATTIVQVSGATSSITLMEIAA